MASEKLSAAQRSKIRRLSQPKEHAPDEAGGELNIVPFLDIITNVLMFVLATISVTFTATIDRLDPGDFGLYAGGQGMGWVDPKEEDMNLPQRAVQRTWIADYLDRFWNALYSADWRDPVNTSPYVIELRPMYVYEIKERMKKQGPDGKPLYRQIPDDLLRVYLALLSILCVLGGKKVSVRGRATARRSLRGRSPRQRSHRQA